MYVKNANGEITGFIREIDQSKYEKEKKQAILDIYNNTDDPKTASELINKWVGEHTELDENNIQKPKRSLYGNPVFDNLSEG
jgi:hypothetical protein|nr:MAG TPA: hypothetical protein [Caudoviricetes sp.]